MSQAQNFLSLKPADFINVLKENNIKRFYFVYNDETGKVESSHKLLQPIADFLQSDKRDFNKHEGMFFQITGKYDVLQGAFVHRTNRGQAAGGVRFWNYNNMEDYFRDGLRLSKGMTHKNALAGLWWGGGKGVMIENPAFDKTDPEIRESIYKEYGEFITSINGCYVTAEDVGTNVNDMANIFSKTRFTTCIPPKTGGSGNPSVPTARGVVSGIEAALYFLKHDTLDGKVIAVQGAGNVGRPLVKFLLDQNVKKIIVRDISPENINQLNKEANSDKVEAGVVDKNDNSILGIDCDILSPCATGAILNPETIPLIKARIICGAANNQLEEPGRDDHLLKEKGIIYVPDFLTNRMGIVNCADEQYGYITNDPSIEKHLSKDWENSVYNTALRVLNEANRKGKTSGEVALELAEKLSMENHPISGHRGKLIIKSLIDNHWENL